MANVLVVDDAKIMRAYIKKMLVDLGHVVLSEAASGFEAIRQYELIKPDFVTMDITMPPQGGVEDGIEAVVRIMKIDPKAKIIMVTSHGEQNKVVKAIQAGACNYVLKPLKAEKLKEVITKVLS